MKESTINLLLSNRLYNPVAYKTDNNVQFISHLIIRKLVQ